MSIISAAEAGRVTALAPRPLPEQSEIAQGISLKATPGKSAVVSVDPAGNPHTAQADIQAKASTGPGGNSRFGWDNEPPHERPMPQPHVNALMAMAAYVAPQSSLGLSAVLSPKK